MTLADEASSEESGLTGRRTRRTAAAGGDVQLERHGLRRDAGGDESRISALRALVQRQRDSRSATGFPADTGPDYELTPCLTPLESLRNDIHVISGIDNPAARVHRAGQRRTTSR